MPTIASFPCLLRRQKIFGLVMQSPQGNGEDCVTSVKNVCIEPRIRVGSPDEAHSFGDVTKTNLQLGPGKELWKVQIVSKERSGHKIVTLPAKRVNMTTPRLHQSTTWVYASPLKISGATKHEEKRTVFKNDHTTGKHQNSKASFTLKWISHFFFQPYFIFGRSNDFKTMFAHISFR